MNWFTRFSQTIQRIFQRSAPDSLRPEDMALNMARMLDLTREDELSCDEVFEILDQYVEMVARGENPEQIMPLLKQHLDMCRDCNDEFQALLGVLEAATL